MVKAPTKAPPRTPVLQPQPTTNAVRPVAIDYSDVYAKLGLESGFDPLPTGLSRWIMRSLKGAGKTSLNKARGPRTLILDFEKTARQIARGEAAFIALRDYAHLERVMNRLHMDAAKPDRPYDHIVFDTLDALQDMVVEQLTKEKGVDDIQEYGKRGKGHSLVSRRVGNLIRQTADWGYGWTCTVHEHWASVSEDEPERLRPSVTPGTFRMIKNDADYVCQLRWVNVKRQVPDAKNSKLSRTEVERALYLYTQTANQSGKDAELSRRIPLSDRILIPLDNSWDPVERDWERAVAQERRRLEQGA